MSMSSTNAATQAKVKLKTLLEATGLSSSDAETAANAAIDNVGKAIIEAVIEEIQRSAETSGGETIS